LSTPIELLQGLASQYGYSGIFLVSVLGSAIPFVPLPYLTIVVLVSGSMNPLLLGIVAGVGAALGKVTSYVLGRLGYLASGDTTKKNLNAIHAAVARYGTWGGVHFRADAASRRRVRDSDGDREASVLAILCR